MKTCSKRVWIHFFLASGDCFLLFKLCEEPDSCFVPSPGQETLSRAMPRHCGRGDLQRLRPEQRRWLVLCVLLSVFFLPVLHVHHQLLLLSETASTSSRGSFHSTVGFQIFFPPYQKLRVLSPPPPPLLTWPFWVAHPSRLRQRACLGCLHSCRTKLTCLMHIPTVRMVAKVVGKKWRPCF